MTYKKHEVMLTFADKASGVYQVHREQYERQANNTIEKS